MIRLLVLTSVSMNAELHRACNAMLALCCSHLKRFCRLGFGPAVCLHGFKHDVCTLASNFQPVQLFKGVQIKSLCILIPPSILRL